MEYIKALRGGFLTGTMPGTEPTPESFCLCFSEPRAGGFWPEQVAGRKILPFRHNTTCSRVCMIARDVRRDSFGMGEPRGMLDL